ncbi:MAG: hypothetical protein JST75_14925 [Bacteroidetes bacterium]|nr:hypothetical protein [Bacteroidota bacterium]
MKSLQELEQIIKNREGVDFFTDSMNNRKRNPGGYDKAMNDAVVAGRKNAEDFLKIARDISAPGHERSFSMYKELFDCMPSKVEDFFIKKAQADSGYKPVEYRNGSKDSEILSGARTFTRPDGSTIKVVPVMNTLDGQAVMDNYKKYFKTRIDAMGYDGIEKDQEDFWNKYGYPASDFVNNTWKI